MPIAIITGASRGLGLALTRTLAGDGWQVVVDARDAAALRAATSALPTVTPVAGDVADPRHRSALIAAADGPIDLLINNASTIGPSPMPFLADYPLDAFEAVLRVNLVAPLALIGLALPRLAPGAQVINVTSDAAVEPYAGWGGYGASKAALDHLTAILAAEHPDLRFHAVDPGDMRTAMHQDAFPGEDISDRPPPEASVPGLLALIRGTEPSGRRRARDVVQAPA